ncbi:MAG: hypothetical protein JNM63_17695 [Spirochaetia bacterium]|nr:hypothetical protein [Spirochaetia bacterium]
MGKLQQIPFSEETLYGALHRFFSNEGYQCRGEVKHCDLSARRGEEWLIVEIKKQMSLKLVAQALKRRAFCPMVYVAIPRPDKIRRGTPYADFKLLTRELGLGLILISFVSNDPAFSQVQIIHPPKPKKISGKTKPTKKARAFQKEWDGRSGDYNAGGTSGRKLITAYREAAVQIAVILERLGPQSPKSIREAGGPEKTLPILYHDVYRWFLHLRPGIYDLAEKGRVEIRETYSAIADLYRKKFFGGQSEILAASFKKVKTVSKTGSPGKRRFQKTVA